MTELLSLEGIWKGYSRGGQWLQVLADVALRADRREIVAVTGGRLEGKTTLLELAAGIERPDQGSVRLDGVSLTGLSDRARARLLGHEIVWLDRRGPQLDVEVSSFVGWPLALHGRRRREAERMAARSLQRVGAQACLGRRWRELSDWQRLLVGLARAFAGTPRVVVIDDLLDALGSRGTQDAFDLLRSLVQESEQPCAVLMSASDIDSAVFADRVSALTSTGGLRLVSGRREASATLIRFPGAFESQGRREA